MITPQDENEVPEAVKKEIQDRRENCEFYPECNLCFDRVEKHDDENYYVYSCSKEYEYGWYDEESNPDIEMRSYSVTWGFDETGDVVWED